MKFEIKPQMGPRFTFNKRLAADLESTIDGMFDEVALTDEETAVFNHVSSELVSNWLQRLGITDAGEWLTGLNLVISPNTYSRISRLIADEVDDLQYEILDVLFEANRKKVTADVTKRLKAYLRTVDWTPPKNEKPSKRLRALADAEGFELTRKNDDKICNQPTDGARVRI